MKILITGPECTGKSTLAAQLRDRLEINLISEYARQYLERNGKEYDQQDLLEIAEGHHSIIQSFEKRSFICDTYLINIKIWSEFKYGNCDSRILELVAAQPAWDHILLCAPDLPWVQDGLRENPLNADELFEIFRQELSTYRLDYKVVEGLGEDRLSNALRQLKTK